MMLWVGKAFQDFGTTQTIRAAQSSTYVSDKWQSKGVGRRLLQHAMEKARERHFDLVVGWVRTDNEASVALVRGLNWKFVGMMPSNDASKPELAYYAYAVPKDLEASGRA